MKAPQSELQRRLARALGTRIRAYRWARCMTQQELADAAGTHRPIVSRIERGVHVPDLLTFAELARALRVTMRDFVRDIDWRPIDEAAHVSLRRTA